MFAADWSESNLSKVVASSQNYSGCLRKMGLAPSGGNQFQRLKEATSQFKLDTSHFNSENRYTGRRIFRSLDEILVKGSPYRGSSSRLKAKLIKQGLLKEECLMCGISKWMGKPLSLHLDHINGEPQDHRLENLRILCPNCHTQTPTYAGKNKAKKTVCSECGCRTSRNQTVCTDCVPKREEVPTHKRCPQCLSTCTVGATMCESCYRKKSRKFDPTPEELQRLVHKMPLTRVAATFGVSDKAIKKRCIKLGVQTHGRGFWAKQTSGRRGT